MTAGDWSTLGDSLHIQAYFAGARVAAGEPAPVFGRPLTADEQECFRDGYAEHLAERDFAFAHARFRLPQALPNIRSKVQDGRAAVARPFTSPPPDLLHEVS